MRCFSKTRFAVFMPALLLAASTFVASYQAQAASLTGDEVTLLIVERLADENLEAKPIISANRIFPDCAGKVNILPMFGGWHTVHVACSVTNGWRFAIRTNLGTPAGGGKGRAGARQNNTAVDIASITGLITSTAGETSDGNASGMKVLALKRSMTKGDIVTADDLTIVKVAERNAIGAFLVGNDIVGRRFKSSLTAGRPVRARHLQPDYLVTKDAEVMITSKAGAISVDVVGIALENGQFGEWIKVQNASSGESVFARIISEKKVSVIAKKG